MKLIEKITGWFLLVSLIGGFLLLCAIHDAKAQTTAACRYNANGVAPTSGSLVEEQCDSAGRLIIAPSTAAAPTKVDPTGGTLTDRSGTITTGGTAQQLAAANTSRRGYLIQNNSTGDLWINTLATAVASQPSFKVPAGAYFETPSTMLATGAISIFGATTGQAFSAREW